MSLRDYEGERVVIWLAYFTAPSRRKGRRFTRLKIGMKELIEAAKELDLDPITQDKVHPASRIKGLIAVRKISSKEKVEKSIYEKLRKNMGKSQTENG